MTLAESSIHLDAILRIFQREVGIGTRNLGTLVQRLNRAVGVFQQVVDGAALLVLDIKFEAIDASETRNHGLCVHLYLGIGDVGRAPIDFFHHGIHVVFLVLTLSPLLQFQGEVAVRRRLVEAYAGACHQ